MRIVHICQSLSREGAGVKVAVEALSREQANLGYEVEVWGLLDDAWESSDRHHWEGAEVIASRYLGPKNFGFSPNFILRLLLHKIDVLHVHGLWTFGNLIALTLAKLSKARVIISVHGMLHASAMNKSRRRKFAIWQLYQYQAIRCADFIHVTSDEESDRVRNMVPQSKIVVIPLGISVPQGEICTTEEKDSLDVLYLGRIAPIKGLARLLEAWSFLEFDFPDWRLRIAGPSESDYLMDLQVLVKELGLRRVYFEPAAFGSFKWKKIRSSSVFVLPSFSENFGLTVAESLALGVPVVVTNRAPWKDIESKSCGIWTDCEPTHLSKALREMMGKTNTERFEMGKRGQNWMREDFSWESVAKHLDCAIRCNMIDE